MNDQLALLCDDSAADSAPDEAEEVVSWQLDEHTRHVGRQGLAAARQALHQSSAGLAA